MIKRALHGISEDQRSLEAKQVLSRSSRVRGRVRGWVRVIDQRTLEAKQAPELNPNPSPDRNPNLSPSPNVDPNPNPDPGPNRDLP